MHYSGSGLDSFIYSFILVSNISGGDRESDSWMLVLLIHLSELPVTLLLKSMGSLTLFVLYYLSCTD